MMKTKKKKENERTSRNVYSCAERERTRGIETITAATTTRAAPRAHALRHPHWMTPPGSLLTRRGDGAARPLRPPRRHPRGGDAGGAEGEEVRAAHRRDRLQVHRGCRRAVRRVLRGPDRFPQAHLRGRRPRPAVRRLHLLVALEHDLRRADGRVRGGDRRRLHALRRD